MDKILQNYQTETSGSEFLFWYFNSRNSGRYANLKAKFFDFETVHVTSWIVI